MAFLCHVPLDDDVVEEREEIMASASGGISHKRTAHFLKPPVPCSEGSNLQLPYLSPKPWWPLHVEFNGWKDPQKKWEKWVDQMQSKNQSLWKKAGIFEAIMCSKYRFHRNDDLVFGLAERWCSETNTFVFPWGEATITLEDMMILGGFSVIGSPVLLPLVDKELVEIEKSLKKVHANFAQKKSHGHLQWLNFFMESGKRHEHEAFLSLWLSRFVFAGNEFDQVGEHVLPIAIHLARGMRIALAPAVLAFVYRDLSLLKESMAVLRSLEDESGEYSVLALSLWAPLQFVQLWAWERFLVFRPEPNIISFGDPRAARWHDMKRSDIGNVRPILDSAGDIFLWRPYALAVDQWKFPEFYREIEQWIVIGLCPDEALDSFARCLRACVLVGIDCEEPYQPHRVAMQFGLDQDIPGLVPRWTESLEVAWINYSKPFDHGASLYIPARLFESDLSIQYQQWWRNRVLVPVDSFQGVSRGKRSSRIQHRRDLPTSRQVGLEGIECHSNTLAAEERASIQVQIKDESDVTPGLLPKGGYTSILGIETSARKQIKGEGNDADVPPGFPPKDNLTRPENSSEKQSERKLANDAEVPPGFPPKKNHALTLNPETSSEKQHQGEGDDADVPSGFPPKKSLTPVKLPEISTQLQIKEKGNDADVPPGFPSTSNNNPVSRPKTPTKQLARSEDFDLKVCPSFDVGDSTFVWPETSVKNYKHGHDFDLNLPPASPSELDSLSEQNQASSYCTVPDESKTSSASQIQDKASSAAAAIERGDSNCTFNFSPEILANMQAFMNRIGRGVGNQSHGSKIRDLFQFGRKPM